MRQAERRRMALSRSHGPLVAALLFTTTFIPFVSAQVSPAPAPFPSFDPPLFLNSSSSPCLQFLASSQYPLFVALVQQAQLVPGVLDALFNFENQLTVFAPTDDALRNGLKEGGLAFLGEPSSLVDLKNILLSHFVGQELSFDDLVGNGTLLTTLSGDPVMIQRNGTVVTADNQTVSADRSVNTADCVLHELQGVIVPSTISPAALQAGLVPTTMVPLVPPVRTPAPTSNASDINLPPIRVDPLIPVETFTPPPVDQPLRIVATTTPAAASSGMRLRVLTPLHVGIGALATLSLTGFLLG